MNHKEKVKLARRLMTPQDVKDHKPLFGTDGWAKHSAHVYTKHTIRQTNAHNRAIKRKKNAAQSKLGT